MFDVIVAVFVGGPEAGGCLSFVPEGEEFGACFADQAGEGAVGVANGLGGLGVVGVGGQGEEGQFVQGAQGGPDLPHRHAVDHRGIGGGAGLGAQ